jgi:hypothetical protein
MIARGTGFHRGNRQAGAARASAHRKYLEYRALGDLEERKGLELHWYAVYHENTEHPHVHVLLAGAGEQKETGKLLPVTLSAEDYQFLRERGHDHSDHDLYAQIIQTVQELDHQDDLAPAHQQRERQEVEFDH